MSFQDQWVELWEQVAIDASITLPSRGPKHWSQYLVEIIEAVLVSAGGVPKTSLPWNNRMAHAIQELAQINGGDPGEWPEVSWNDRILRRTQELIDTGVGGGGVSWVKLTQAMWDAGTAVTTNSTLKSQGFDGSGNLQLTALAMAAARDGHREVSGRSIPVASILSTFNPATHDIGVYIDAPNSGGDANLICGISLVENAGAAGDGVGIAVSQTRVTHQGPSSSDTSIVDAGLSAAYALVSVSADTVSCSVRAKGTSNGGEFYEVSGSATNTLDALTFSNAKIFISLGSYSGVQSEDEVWTGGVYFAAIPKIAAPS